MIMTLLGLKMPSLNFWNFVLTMWMAKTLGNCSQMSELAPAAHSEVLKKSFLPIVNLSISTVAYEEYTEKSQCLSLHRENY